MAFDPNKLQAVKQASTGFDPARLQAAKQPGLLLTAETPMPIPGAVNPDQGRSIDPNFVQPNLQAEPGLESPAGQRLLENAGTVAAGAGVGALAGLGALKAAPKLASAASKTVSIGKGLVRGTSSLGEDIAAAERARGIVTNLPTSVPSGGKGLTKVVGEIQDAGDLVKSGLRQDNPQFLQQLKNDFDRAQTILDRGKSAVGKKNYAIVAKAKEAINNALNELVPGREAAQLSAKTAYVRNKALQAGIILEGARRLKNAAIGGLRN